jgi:catechol 2,3-dioxygenase-like lactoylglutathione lyase family enzyme
MSIPDYIYKSSFHSVTALIPTGGSLAEALAFYTEQMGFSIVWQDGFMAGIARDGVAFNLVENDDRAWADNASFSIGVSDLEALYQEYRHISAKVGSLETKAWGRREFHLIAPSGVCFQFYQGEAHSY